MVSELEKKTAIQEGHNGVSLDDSVIKAFSSPPATWLAEPHEDGLFKQMIEQWPQLSSLHSVYKCYWSNVLVNFWLKKNALISQEYVDHSSFLEVCNCEQLISHLLKASDDFYSLLKSSSFITSTMAVLLINQSNESKQLLESFFSDQKISLEHKILSIVIFFEKQQDVEGLLKIACVKDLLLKLMANESNASNDVDTKHNEVEKKLNNLLENKQLFTSKLVQLACGFLASDSTRKLDEKCKQVLRHLANELSMDKSYSIDVLNQLLQTKSESTMKAVFMACYMLNKLPHENDLLGINLPLACLLKGYYSLIKQLAHYGLELTDRQRDVIEQALCHADYQESALYSCLLKANINLNAKMKMQYNPLLIALIFKRESLYDEFLSKGANLDNSLLTTLTQFLFSALIFSDRELIKKALNLVVDYSLQNPLKQTLFLATMWYGHERLCRLILDKHSLTDLEKSIIEKFLLVYVEINNKTMLDFILPLVKESKFRNKQGLSAIMVAACQGELDLVKKLFSISQVSDDDKKLLGTKLLKAIKSNDHHNIEALLFLKPNLNQSDEDGSLLAHAIKMKNEQVVEQLIDAGAQLTSEDESNSAQFVNEALSTDSLQLIKLLFKVSSDVSQLTSGENSLLFEALNKESQKVGAYLLNKGIKLSGSESALLIDTLVSALKNENMSFVELLLKAGVKTNEASQEKLTALLESAVQKEQIELINLLLTNKALLKVNGELIKKLIKQSVLQGSQSVLTLLLEKFSQTPQQAKMLLSFVLNEGNHQIKLLRSLYEKMPFANMTVEMFSLLGISAAAQGNNSLLKALIRTGVDIEKSFDGKTALSEACAHQQDKSMELLLSISKDKVSEKQALFRGKLLLESLEKNYDRGCELLINNGADLTVTNNTGNGLLFLTFDKRKTGLQKLLMDAGASLTLQDKQSLEHSMLQALHTNDINTVKAVNELGLQLKDVSSIDSNLISKLMSNNFIQLLEVLVNQGLKLEGVSASILGEFLLGNIGKLSHVLFDEVASSGADLTLRDKAGETVLVKAALQGEQKTVMKLKELNAELSKDEVELLSNELVTAVRLQRGNTVHAIEATGITLDKLLLESVKSEQTDRVKLLLANEGNKDCVDEKGHGLLYLAVNTKNTHLMQLLQDAGVRINEKDKDELETVLLDSILNDDVDKVKLIVNAGVPLQESSKLNNQFITQLITNNKIAMLDFLTAAGFRIRNIDKSLLGYTLLQNSDELSPQLMTEMITAGADINLRNSFGETPLIKAALEGKNQSVIALLKAGAKLVNEDKVLLGKELIMAIKFERKDVIQALVQAGASIDEKNDNGEIAILCAAEKNNIALVRLLINRGADFIGVIKSIEDVEKIRQISQTLWLERESIPEQVRGDYNLLLDYIQSRNNKELSDKELKLLVLRQSLVYMIGLKLLVWQGHTQYMVVSDVEAICRENASLIKSQGLFSSDDFQSLMDTFLLNISTQPTES